jgi:hypothetical protein
MPEDLPMFLIIQIEGTALSFKNTPSALGLI